MENDDFKCHCEHENGRDANSGIMCGFIDEIDGAISGQFDSVAYCNWNEWCIGPFDITESVNGKHFGKEKLCAKGNLT